MIIDVRHRWVVDCSEPIVNDGLLTLEAIAEIRSALGHLLINSDRAVLDGKSTLITQEDHLEVAGGVYRKYLMNHKCRGF